MVGPSPNFNEIEFRGKYDRLSKAAMIGGATVTPRATRLIDGAAKTVIIGDPITITFNSAGEFAVLLPSTNDPDISAGALGETFTYLYTENFAGGQSFDFSLPMSYATTGRDLSDVYQINQSPQIPIGGSYATAADLQTLSSRVQSLEEGVAATIPTASETVVGKSRYATQAETTTGTLTSAAVVPARLPAATRAQIESMLVAGANVTFTYGSSGSTRTITIAAAAAGTGLDASSVRSEVASELLAGTGVTITPAGSGATRTLTISAGALDESAVRTAVEGELVAGTNITITPAGTGTTRTLTISSTGGGGGTTTAATEAAAGIVELASAAEIIAGTDATRAVSPARLAGKTWDAAAVTSGTFATTRIPDLSATYLVTAALNDTPVQVRHGGGTAPNRPATTRPVQWFVPAATPPAKTGTTAGGSYAAVDGLDVIWTY